MNFLDKGLPGPFSAMVHYLLAPDAAGESEGIGAGHRLPGGQEARPPGSSQQPLIITSMPRQMVKATSTGIATSLFRLDLREHTATS
jgi:hypothetical protein